MNVIELAEQQGDRWLLNEDVTNPEFEKLLYSERKDTGCIYAEPDYGYIHRELSKKGVTLTLLWNEYGKFM